jgi:hypothetical protein
MKRSYYDDDDEDESYASSSDDDESEKENVFVNYGDYGDDDEMVTSSSTMCQKRCLEDEVMARDDRPYMLQLHANNNDDVYFDYHPQGNQVDPVSTGSMVTGISPHGSTLGTLEYNLRHAIEKRDEARTTMCLTEFFRFFVLLNRPMKRFVSANLDRQSRLELMCSFGPFSTSASLGMHQRLLTTLIGIYVRQVGVATPTALSFLLDEWKMYERVLFHRPALALVKLIGMGTTLCHSKKNASVAYTRHVFEDSSKMREWRNEVLKRPDVMTTFLPDADHAYKARKMLLCNKVYFNNRLRLRRYQTICIGNPHPEYMCQGGSMNRAQILKLVDGIKQSMPSDAGPDATAVLQDMEDTMVYLSGHVNNVYDRDAYDNLQVDVQILMYLFHRVLVETSKTCLQGPDSLLRTSQAIVLSAPNKLTEEYGQRLWTSCPDMMDFLKYGIQGEPIVKMKTKKRGTPTIHDLMDVFHPILVPKIHETAPPSIFRDNDNIVRECPTSDVPRVQKSLRFLYGLYRLHVMWAKYTSSKVMSNPKTTETTRIMVDREFFDIKQPYRVLYRCQDTGVCAAEVCLQGNVATEFKKTQQTTTSSSTGCRVERVETIGTTDIGEAEIFADHLLRCSNEGEGDPTTLKAVMVGPWPLQDMARLEKETTQSQAMKTTLGVQPDIVAVKKLMLLDYSVLLENHTNPTTQILGRMYAWVVYIPCLTTTSSENHVVMTIDQLKHMTGQDPTLNKTAKSILRPMQLVRQIAIMKRVCGEFCSWRIGDNYVSFTVQVQDAVIRLENIRMHTISETLLGKCPDYRHSAQESPAQTMAIIQNLLELCRTKTQYGGANTELARCETLLINQIS